MNWFVGRESINRLALALLLTFFYFAGARANSNASSQTPVEKTVVVYGVKINYIEAGTGPDVILLHGLGGDSRNWALNVLPLAAKFHVLVPDQIGFGKSEKPLIAYRVGTYVDFLDRFRRELRIKRASLVGNSMGGWIAAAYTIAYPDKVDKLVLEDAAGYALPKDFDTRLLYGLNPSTREGMRKVASSVFYNKLFSSDAAIDQALTQRLNAGDGYTINSIIESIIRGEDMLDNRVKDIKAPTLVLWGRQDGLTPLAEGERFKREIQNSTMMVFDQCGHVPNVEKASEFNDAVLQFLQKT